MKFMEINGPFLSLPVANINTLARDINACAGELELVEYISLGSAIDGI